MSTQNGIIYSAYLNIMRAKFVSLLSAHHPPGRMTCHDQLIDVGVVIAHKVV